MRSTERIRVALFLSSMAGGGVERMMLNLARGFGNIGLDIDVVLAKAVGPCLADIPDRCALIDLRRNWSDGDKRVVLSLFALIGYLKRRKPGVLIAAPGYAGVIALLARKLARNTVRIFVIVDVALSEFRHGRWHERLLVRLGRYWYRQADAIVATYPKAAKDVIELTGAPPKRVRTIYSPFVTADLFNAAKATPDHPWFGLPNTRIVLGVGRLTKEKSFDSLVRAFQIVRARHRAKLMILGEGAERRPLNALINELGLAEDIAMPGFVRNPYCYISNASVLVLPSKREAFGGVLVEAMALGTPVVATNSPTGGPADILQNGKYGRLVRVGDLEGIAHAICEMLDTPPEPSFLKERAEAFRLENAIAQYVELIERAIPLCPNY